MLVGSMLEKLPSVCTPTHTFVSECHTIFLAADVREHSAIWFVFAL
uniref:Uncharacterized protein n=1 Tax=Anguilla anguilla TaxID=7936 RepID=A0A0E9QPB2_ANGAN